MRFAHPGERLAVHDGRVVRRQLSTCPIGGADAVEAIRALREHADRLPEVIEAREAPEVKLAELAAERRSESEMAAIDDALAIMEMEITEGERGVSGDEHFHRATTTAVHSSLLARLVGEIAELVRETRIESLVTARRRQSA